jgi:hypothetical protein
MRSRMGTQMTQRRSEPAEFDRTSSRYTEAMPTRRGHQFQEICALVLAKIDAEIALLEPVAMQPLGSVEQRRATIELAHLKGYRTRFAERLMIAKAGLKPTK